MQTQTQAEPSRVAFKREPNEKRLIQAAAVRDLCGGVSDMWLWRRLDGDPAFPRPVYIMRRRYWREADVLAWLDAQPGKPARPAA